MSGSTSHRGTNADENTTCYNGWKLKIYNILKCIADSIQTLLG